MNPVWSPDGKHLYFSSDRGGSMNLWRVAIDEESGERLGEPMPVTTGASASRSHLSFSTDGRQIAYVENIETWSLQKLVFDSTTETIQGGAVPVTRGSRKPWISDPSPDGEWLAFSTRGKQEDIFLIRPDGTGLRQLTDDVHKDRQPRWSPDGQRIAFYSDRSGNYEIWAINPDGSELRQLTDDPSAAFLYAIWSPDRSRMASFDFQNNVSYVFDPAKPWKEQTPDELPPMNEAGDRFGVQDWSRDGKWLVGYARTKGGDPGGIIVFSLETRTYRRVVDFGEWPSWLADSRRLLFDDQGKIFLLDTESKEYRELFANPAGRAEFTRPSRDEGTIYFTLSTAEADIWLMTLE